MNTTILTGRRSLTALVIAVVIAASIAAAAIATAGHARTAKAQKPTIVLVHGGWADSSGWNAEITKLEQLGYPVIAPATRSAASPPMPSTSAASCAPSTARSFSSGTPTAAP